MTRQTSAPLVHANLGATYRRAQEIARTYAQDLGLDLEPPYQRGDVWTLDQRIALVRSWLTGVPTGTVLLADRCTDAWRDAHDGKSPLDNGDPMYAVIDGKQRITTALMWFSSELLIPASWVDPSYIERAEDTADGPYVRHNGLTKVGRNMLVNRALIQVAEAQPATIEEEAAIYLLVNGGGTPQSDADMANAQHVATGPCTVAWHAHPDGQHGDTCRFDQPA